MITIEERTKFWDNTYLYKIVSNENLLVHDTVSWIQKSVHTNKFKKSKRQQVNAIQNLCEESDCIYKIKQYNMHAYEYTELYINAVNIELHFGKKLNNGKDPNYAISLLISENKSKFCK